MFIKSNFLIQEKIMSILLVNFNRIRKLYYVKSITWEDSLRVMTKMNKSIEVVLRDKITEIFPDLASYLR